jgi:hypothetical protein
VSRLLAAVLAVALAAVARAEESPRSGSFEIMTGQYLPDLDAEFPAARRPGPFEKTFGTKPSWMFRGGWSYALYHAWGTLEVGGQVGYFTKSGFGEFATGGGVSGDKTTFRFIPTSATVTYRFDTLANGYALPVAPYGRLALERYNWWVNDGAGKTTKYGATNGWSAAGGLCLLLDFFDPGMGRELDRDTGINHSYAFAEARKTFVDDFGSSTSWILSDKASVSWSFGLMFVY